MADVYKHYKGGIYFIIGMGKHTESEEDLVIYEGTDGRLWARPSSMFLDEVEVNGVKTKRFEHIGHFYR